MNEIWKNIKDFEMYQVSNYGRVKSLRNNIILKKNVNSSNGYEQVTLHNKGYVKTFSVHRLVAEAFLKNPQNLPQVNHRNEIKTDNKVEIVNGRVVYTNLEWCDAKYNANYGTKNDKFKKQTKQFTLKGELVKVWSSLAEIQEKLGFRKSNLSSCCNGRLPHAYGFVWRFV